ncbi:MAG: DUF5069 domain-containing protein [Verrucomicrobiota bacterium]|nr:DUF5069 domain-containing protein [Verrucomicrobiota bacterium]
MQSVPGMMEESNWKSRFRELFESSRQRFKSGHHSVELLFGDDEINFLSSIGCQAQELFDFVEDHVRYGEPDAEMALMVAAVRERYLREVQHGVCSKKVAHASLLPPKPQAMEGIPWLPRLIAKARAKLRGELDQSTMYGCAGDRPFLASYDMDLVQFLELVWNAGEDDRAILNALRRAKDRLND